MSVTIETDLKEILDKLDQKMDRQFEQLNQKMDRQFEKVEQKVDRMQADITELQLGQAKIEGDIKALDNKGSVIQPIITGITVAFAGGGLLALYKYLP
jgi:chromosome segregation ATPase